MSVPSLNPSEPPNAIGQRLCSDPEFIRSCEDSWAPIQFYFRVHYKEHNPDPTGVNDPFVMDFLFAEFGLKRSEAGNLTLPLLRELLLLDHRWRTAPSDNIRRHVEIEAADLRGKLTNLPNLSDGGRAFLKALRKFPTPSQAMSKTKPSDSSDPSGARGNPIPLEFRSRPTTKIAAAKALKLPGLRAAKVKTLNGMIKDGDVRCYPGVNRVRWTFDIRDIPGLPPLIDKPQARN